jgi:hypothetical protein
MTKEQFYALLDTFDLEVIFIKKTTGEERVLRCSNKIPNQLNESKPKIPDSDERVVVFDLEKRDWRSFYLGSVIEINVLSSTFGMLNG